MNNKSIGVFDSGIGGLTVLKELKNKMPNEKYIYLGDTKNFPYGEKSKEEILKYARNNIEMLMKENVKMIVIACGTVTSQALEIVKKEYDIPMIGIIEPTVNNVIKNDVKKVGVMATTGTIRSVVWEKKIKEKDSEIKVINKACPLLASIAEEGKANSKEGQDAICEYVKIFKENNIHTIILGCTHYSLFNEVIKKEFEYDVNLIDTGVSVANEMQEFLTTNNMEGKNQDNELKVIITKEIDGFDKKMKNILKDVENVNLLVKTY